MSGSKHKPRLGPWLIEQVNNGQYEGLHWLDVNKMQFQMPWNQTSRQDRSTGRCIFQAWAIATHKFQEGRDVPNPPKWKTNLRCALNKSQDFQMVKDCSKDSPPFKIYEIKRSNADGGRVCDEDDMEMECTDQESSPELIPPGVENSISPQQMDHLYNLDSLTLIGSNNVGKSNHQDSCSKMPGSNHCLASWEPESIMYPAQAPSPVRSHEMGSDCPLVLPNCIPLQQQELPLLAQAMPQVVPNGRFLEDLSSPTMLPGSELEITVEYRGRRMFHTVLPREQDGCRLHTGSLLPHNSIHSGILGPQSYQQIQFPPVDDIESIRQKRLTMHLLQHSERGLLLRSGDEGIFAKRLCQCKVYWSGLGTGPGLASETKPQVLCRETEICLFEYQFFFQELINFLEGRSLVLPEYRILLCFGEEWPDPNKPKHRKLIMVQVVPTVMRMLSEMASGVSLSSLSLNSDQLQISGQNDNDRLVPFVKALLQTHANLHTN